MKKCYLCLVAAIVFVSLTITSCAPQTAVPPTSAMVAATSTTKPACDKTFKVAWVYDGPTGDKGWVDAHEVGRLYVVKNLLCIETLTVENVAEGDAERVFTDLVKRGYQMIFATTFGYMDAAFTVAEANPKVIFEHVFGYKTRENMAVYAGRLYQTRFLSGIVAGMMTKKNEIGYLASFPFPEVISGIDGFALGVKAVNPDAKIHVVYVNSWYDPVVERQGAEALIDLGIDMLSMHTGSPAAMLAAEERGISGIGEYDMYVDAPKAVLVTVQWNWGPYYLETVKAAQAGTWKEHNFYGGLETGIHQLGPFASTVPQEVKDAVAKWKQKILGGWDVFTGPIYDNKGKLVVAEGVTMSEDQIKQMEWLVDNVIAPTTK